MVTFGAVKEREFTLIEQGEYCLTLFELEESEGQWGDRMVWKFLVAPVDDFTNYIARDNGEEKTVWVFTDRDIVIGSFCQELVEVLSGRKFEKDGVPPSEDDLLGKRCIGYITHETPTRGKNAGKKREKVVEGSLKPFGGPHKKIAPNVRPAPTQVSADPSSEEIDRATLATEIERQIGKLSRLNSTRGQEARAAVMDSDLDTAPLADIQTLLDQIKATVTAELDS